MKQEMMGWQWHQPDFMQIICTSLQTDNHASTSSIKLVTGRTLFLMPNQQCQALKAIRRINNNLEHSLAWGPRNAEAHKYWIYRVAG